VDPAKCRSQRLRILCFLKQSDGGNSRCPGFETICCIRFIHTPDRNYLDFDSPTNVCEKREALRGSKSTLGRGVEDRSEESVAGARLLRYTRFLKAVTGHAN
jgi:hypothetical protein